MIKDALLFSRHLKSTYGLDDAWNWIFRCVVMALGFAFHIQVFAAWFVGIEMSISFIVYTHYGKILRMYGKEALMERMGDK